MSREGIRLTTSDGFEVITDHIDWITAGGELRLRAVSESIHDFDGQWIQARDELGRPIVLPRIADAPCWEVARTKSGRYMVREVAR